MKKGNSHSLWLALLLGTVFLTPTPSFAQMYVGAYGALANPTLSSDPPSGVDIIADGSLTGLEFQGLFTCVANPYVVGGRIGYWLKALNAPYLGVEVDAYKASEKIVCQESYQNQPKTIVTPIEHANVDLAAVAVNALARYSFTDLQSENGWFPGGNVYAGVGAGVIHAEVDDIALKHYAPHPEGRRLGLITGETTVVKGGKATAPVLHVIAGGRIYITDNAAFFMEMKWVTADLPLQEWELDYDSLHFNVGLEVHFGPGVN